MKAHIIDSNGKKIYCWIVESGDTLFGIAKETGYSSWTDIWDHEMNASIRARCGGSPINIRPYDVILLPNKPAIDEAAYDDAPTSRLLEIFVGLRTNPRSSEESKALQEVKREIDRRIRPPKSDLKFARTPREIWLARHALDQSVMSPEEVRACQMQRCREAGLHLCPAGPWHAKVQPDVIVTIGTLDRCLSELLVLAKSDLSEADRQTLKHHAEDMQGVAEKMLSLLSAKK